jgi:2-C-methyl-D-erythritol 4-phosphate cytidylyltransferase
MGLDIPKQFVLIKGKPVIIHTLSVFAAHPSIDSIGVVCIDGWQEVLADYARQYHIDKLDWIVPGGRTAQESIHRGIQQLIKPGGGHLTGDSHRSFAADLGADAASGSVVVGRRAASSPDSSVWRSTTADPAITGKESTVSDVADNWPAPINDIVVIHDAIRPLVSPEIISDVLATCVAFGNGVTSLPYQDQIFELDGREPDSTVKYIPRDSLRRVATPQAYRLDTLVDRYAQAVAQGVGLSASSYTNTMMVDLGERLHFASGSDQNIKLTTQEDLVICEAILEWRDRLATRSAGQVDLGGLADCLGAGQASNLWSDSDHRSRRQDLTRQLATGPMGRDLAHSSPSKPSSSQSPPAGRDTIVVVKAA